MERKKYCLASFKCVKHGSDSILVWCSIVWSGTDKREIIDEILDARKYICISLDHLTGSVLNLEIRDGFWCQPDNNSRHLEKITKEYLLLMRLPITQILQLYLQLPVVTKKLVELIPRRLQDNNGLLTKF